jgi:hypothetical protein
VRSCRSSVEHDLRHVVIRAPEGLRAIYETGPFPEGAVLVKEEFDDRACARLAGYTRMTKGLRGSDPDGADWSWARLDETGAIREDGKLPRCLGCHRSQCQARDLACAVP